MHFIFFLLCFIAGSFNGAFFLIHHYGLNDILVRGSGNPGATNALRLYGLKAGLFVFLFDFIKSFLPLYMARYLGIDANTFFLGLTASICGHCFSPLLKFNGGKGVATLFGGFAAYSLPLTLWTGLLWVCVYISTGLSALSAISVLMFLGGHFFNTSTTTLFWALFIVFIRHSPNWKQWKQSERTLVSTVSQEQEP
jgi:glycerol-3-phosphate acyltransferase PlsY